MSQGVDPKLLASLKALLAILSDADAAGFAVWHIMVRDKAHAVRNALVRLYPLSQVERDINEVQLAASEFYSPEETDKFLATPQALLGHVTPLVAISQGRKAEVIALLEVLKTGAFA